ncbi:MAG: metal-sulfur cluster assembly factor [Gemmatimonadetes bacterium]|nr:metal-sulfur cluster assembly factor [Gemmatimonadota bacterium]
MQETEYRHRTDSVEEKIRLLATAHREGNLDVAMSLAESIKDTVGFERQRRVSGHGASEAVSSPAPNFGRVAELPDPWADWARGWAFYKVLEIVESAGLGRSREPVETVVEFAADQVNDLRRELRVARIDDESATLGEVPSQVCREALDGGLRSCRLLLQVDTPPNGRVRFLVLYGNPDAELPEYPSDLSVSGEEFGLSIAGNHFTAHLSPQNGQLQRLQFRRGFGTVPYGAPLELNTGGEGHGEPPGIDWGHDYMASGNYQKFRVTGWSRCPNYEVIRGPLCVQVRRWGFPRSPLHPVFTPSRLHMDLTYTFYAGLPWFLKESRMDALTRFETTVVRDDEWLFYGMPFSDSVWIDREGNLHEGEVPASHENDQWGAGFFHRESRDAFIALWLEHRSENCGPLNHSGPPNLSYFGRGQIWCRAAIQGRTEMREGSALFQKNAYFASHYPEQNGREIVQDLRRRLLNPLLVSEGELPEVEAAANGRLGRPGETGLTPAGAADLALKRSVWDALRQVEDDQLGRIDSNVVDMGYIYDLRVDGGVVRILMTMPHRGRPKYRFIGNPIRDRVLAVDGVRECIVDFTWEPEWTAARLTRTGSRSLGL